MSGIDDKEYDVEDRTSDIKFSIDQLDVISSLSFKQLGTLGTFTPEQIYAIRLAYNERVRTKCQTSNSRC